MGHIPRASPDDAGTRPRPGYEIDGDLGEGHSRGLIAHVHRTRTPLPLRQGRDRRVPGVQPLARPGGGARDPPVHRPGLRLQRLQAPAHGALRGRRGGGRLDLLAGDRRPRPVRGLRRHLGGEVRAARLDAARRRLLGARVLRLGARDQRQAAVARLRGLRTDRRHRPGHRVHLPGVDADEVVPRPAGPGHRAGDHGVRRWCAHREPAVERPHVLLRGAAPSRRTSSPAWSRPSSPSR